MIIDSHCHAWEIWPYQPPVPDPQSRGCAEQLLHEMDLNGVSKAIVICASIDHNPVNNSYIAEQVALYPDRLIQFADVDCSWSANYHQPGAAMRLRGVAKQFSLRGFTHYLKQDDDGAWLYSVEGLEFFAVAAEFGLIASLSCYPHQFAAVRKLAEHFPMVPFLLHHLGHLKNGDAAQFDDLRDLVPVDNIYIKVSGLYYATAGKSWDFPYRDTVELVQAIYKDFGAARLCWGSDYPVSRGYLTYSQTLACLQHYCDFMNADEQTMVLGKTMAQLLSRGMN